MEKRLTPAELADAITDFVNSSNLDKCDEFVEAMSREHRTLQQLTFRLFLKLMENMASDDYRTDDRNQGSKDIAKTIMKGFREAQKAKYISQGVTEARAEEYVSGDGSKPSRYLGTI